MALSFFVSFMHALWTKKSVKEVNSKSYLPDGFDTHYHSMQRNVSLINLFPHTDTVVEADHTTYLGWLSWMIFNV